MPNKDRRYRFTEAEEKEIDAAWAAVEDTEWTGGGKECTNEKKKQHSASAEKLG